MFVDWSYTDHFHRILKNNQLIGLIPSTLSQIPNLKILWVKFMLSITIGFNRDRAWGKITNAIKFIALRDLAQNKLSGEIPRLIYWNEVLQYLWVWLTSWNIVVFISDQQSCGPNILLLPNRGLRGNNLQGSLSPDLCQLTGLWYL